MRNARNRLLFCAAFLIPPAVFVCLTSSFAAYENFGAGARPCAMGGAFSAVADDANAVFYNPSGLFQVEKKEVALSYSRLFTGLKGVQSWSGFGTFVLPMKSLRSAVGVSWANTTVNGIYSESAGIFSLAHHRAVFAWECAVGVNFKYMRINYDLDSAAQNDPVFRNGGMAHDWSVDTGILLKSKGGLFKGSRFSFVMKDVDRPNFGFKDKVRMPLTYRGGFSYELMTLLGGNDSFSLLKNLVVALDYSTYDRVRGYFGGMETKFSAFPLSVRTGTAYENGTFRDLAAGLSYSLPLFDYFDTQIDYSFVYPIRVMNSAGTHRASVAFRF